MDLTSILYPEIEPYHSGMLQVSDLHTLYYEEVGNPQGQPVVFLHGGPGGGFSPLARRYFDPQFYRDHPVRPARVREIDPARRAAREHHPRPGDGYRAPARDAGIERWLVFGGSWGSTLALAYAIHFPQRVIGLVLRGIFLCRQIGNRLALQGRRLARLSGRLGAVHRAHPARGARRPAGGLLPPPDRSGSAGAVRLPPGPGAAGKRTVRAIPRIRLRWKRTRTRLKPWRSRASRPIILSITAFSRATASCWRTPRRSTLSRPASSRGATIWSARSPRPGN